DPSICATQVSPMLNGGFNFSKSKQDDGYHLGFPHLNTAFMLCKRDAMKAIGATWRGYHVAHPTHLAKNDLDYLVSQFGAEVRYLSPVDQDVILVKLFSYDIGAWAYHQIKKTGYRLNPNPLPSE